MGKRNTDTQKVGGKGWKKGWERKGGKRRKGEKRRL